MNFRAETATSWERPAWSFGLRQREQAAQLLAFSLEVPILSSAAMGTIDPGGLCVAMNFACV